MSHIEVLKQALEALEEIIHWYAVRDRNDVLLNFVDQNPEIKKSMKAITSLRQVIADLEKQEPVGEVDNTGMAVIWANKPMNGAKLYTHPQPKREPLTDEQKQLKFIKWGLIPANQSWEIQDWFYAGIAYAEAVHDIKGEA